MRILFIAILVATDILFTDAQKKPLPLDVYKNWPSMHPLAISNDGNYIAYRIHSEKTDTTWLQATGKDWKKGIEKVKSVAFSPDGRNFLFLCKNDSLGILDIVKDTVSYLFPVNSFKLSPGGSTSWLYILFKNPADSLVVVNLTSKERKSYPGVSGYFFDDDGSNLVLQSINKKNANPDKSITWLDLRDGTKTKISNTWPLGNVAFDGAKTQVAFLTEETIRGKPERVLKCFRKGMDSSSTIADRTTAGLRGCLIHPGGLFFNKKGDMLFFRVEKKTNSRLIRAKNDSVGVEIDDYKSEMSPEPERYNNLALAVAELSAPKTAIRLEQDDDFSSISNETPELDYILTLAIPQHAKSKVFGPYDRYRSDLYLTDTKKGMRKLLKSNAFLDYPQFSTNGKFVIWYDREAKKWETYCIINGITKNITPEKSEVIDSEKDDAREVAGTEGIAGWGEKDQSVFIYDRYDLWQLDPKGISPAINITNGVGHKNNIRFRYQPFFRKSISLHDTLILYALNTITKENGFYSVIPASPASLTRLRMGSPALFYGNLPTPNINGISFPSYLLKAKTANKYFLVCMDYDRYPNLYMTTDFIDYKALTNLEPQRNYLWYTAELLHLSLPNGVKTEAIVYKPENFDPKIRYPVIFYYYEKNAIGLHLFIHPELSNGCLNIPWFVSNGYIVCIPDIIYYKHGYPGECAFQAVNAAAGALSRMSWIDSTKMGLQGHSYGGWETNYIITRTHRFAAAASASGYSDLVSLNSEYSARQGGYFESEQGRIYARFCDNPKLYIENSPIFKVSNVSTPILIMHTRNDTRVPYLQGKEWYNTLTRMYKKNWLISYEEDDHVLANERNKLDYSIRLGQFFNYYLKLTLPPVWMIQDRISNFTEKPELDSTGKKP